EQVLENDQVLANEVLCSVPQPGAGDVRHVRAPVRFGQKFAGGVKAAPQLGEDSVAILKGLGFESSEIESFIDQGITQST
ncbi:MAG: CoA transferase, partial [Pseudomonadota bacterium]|nr:CoA transferase [Pseudomonadota bacterium]